VHCEQPKNPLYWTAFITNALAGKSQVVAISAAQHKTDSSPAGDTVILAETNRMQDIIPSTFSKILCARTLKLSDHP